MCYAIGDNPNMRESTTVKAKQLDTDKPRVPKPPHPVHRREPLPWQCPKPPEEDPDAPARVEAILESPSYRRADADLDFLARDSMRGVRLQIDVNGSDKMCQMAAWECTSLVERKGREALVSCVAARIEARGA